MKPVLAWVKANLVSVILLAITVIALPTMLIIGSSMGKKLRESVQSDVTRQMREVTGITVQYSLEPLTPGAPSFSMTMPPNKATTEALTALLEATAKEAEEVRAKIVAFNQRNKGLLVEGVLPEPESAIVAPERLDAMARAWARAHAPLIERLGGGMPPDAETALRQLREIAFRVEQDMTGGRPDVALTPEQREAFTERMSQERVHLYTSRASRLRFYADRRVFADVAPWTETTSPPLELAWEWQWRYWLQDDLVRAIANANAGAPSLLEAPVKRIERIEIDPFTYTGTGQGGGDATAEVRRDYSRSITGRSGWPASPNPVYDVRYANMVLLVDSAQLPRLFDAISTTNLMSVIDIDVVDVGDLREHLRQGFVYTQSPASIVRVTLRVESVWLRDWTSRLMPPRVREAMIGGGGAGSFDDGSGAARGRAPARGQAQQDGFDEYGSERRD